MFKLFETALYKASEKGHTEIVKLLLEQEGIDVNTRNKNSTSALLISIKGKYSEISELLLSHKGIIVTDENILTFLTKTFSFI